MCEKKTNFFSDAIKQRPHDFDFFLMVKQLIKTTIEFMRADERLYQVLNNNLEANEEFKQQLIEIFPHSPNFGFDNLVRAALDTGQISSRYAPAFIAGVFEILLEHIDRLLPSDNPAEEIESVVDQFISMMQYGISAKRKSIDL